MGAILDAPVLDDFSDGVVGNGVEAAQHLVGDGAGCVAGFDPRFDALTVVGCARGQCDWVFHQLERNRT